MKFIDSPSPENFVLTHKKKRIIKAFMKEYCFSYNLYYIYRHDGFIPELDDFIAFLKDRLVFLKNIHCFYAIKTISTNREKMKFQGVIFQYKDDIITVDFSN
ncbi:hypothetical protein [Flavobacterium sp.]|uniref:hypothetical protein n=2 Tax=Flavobacterium sp. TaxID=239 RepID=UPI0040489F88